MDYDDVLERVREIRIESADDEAAHWDEDALHRDVLTDIATNSTDPKSRDIARLALRTREIEFARWSA